MERWEDGTMWCSTMTRHRRDVQWRQSRGVDQDRQDLELWRQILRSLGQFRGVGVEADRGRGQDPGHALAPGHVLTTLDHVHALVLVLVLDQDHAHHIARQEGLTRKHARAGSQTAIATTEIGISNQAPDSPVLVEVGTPSSTQMHLVFGLTVGQPCRLREKESISIHGDRLHLLTTAVAPKSSITMSPSSRR